MKVEDTAIDFTKPNENVRPLFSFGILQKNDGHVRSLTGDFQIGGRTALPLHVIPHRRLTLSRVSCRAQTVGTVPPSITYSLPVMDDARSEARNATNSATSSGRFGLPNGMPPRESMIRCLAASVLMPER